METRPYLLLDIDGTLNPDLRGTWDSPDPDTRTRIRAAGWQMSPGPLFNGRPIWYNPTASATIRNIARQTGAELAWATRWNEQAQYFAAATGLPTDMPIAPTHPALTKAATVIPWTEGRPFVWIDDEQDVADACTEPWQHCVQVSITVGVTRGWLDETERFLKIVRQTVPFSRPND